MSAYTETLVSAAAYRARRYWTWARCARLSGWPDVAVGLEQEAAREMRRARYTRTERARGGLANRPLTMEERCGMLTERVRGRCWR